MELRHIACPHGKGSNQSQSAAQLPEAASVKSCPSQALLARTARGIQELRRLRLSVVNLRSHHTTSTRTM